MSSARPPSAPAFAPLALAAALGLAASLPLAPLTWSAAEPAGHLLLVWPAVGLLSLLASQRWRLPSVRGPLPGLAWLAAGAAGSAVLGRRATDALMVCAAELPISSPVALGFDLGDALLVLGLLVVTTPFALRGALRAPRPGLAILAVAAVVAVAVPVLGGGGRTPSLPQLTDPGGAVALLPTAAALAWCGLLVGPGALALDPRRRLLHRLAPPALLAVLAGGSGLLLLQRFGGASLDGDAVLARAGSRAFGAYGDRIGAGLETVALLLLLSVLLVLSVRLASRSLPRLGGWALPLVALAAVVLQSRLAFDVLVPLAAISGWLALLLGGDRARPST